MFATYISVCRSIIFEYMISAIIDFFLPITHVRKISIIIATLIAILISAIITIFNVLFKLHTIKLLWDVNSITIVNASAKFFGSAANNMITSVTCIHFNPHMSFMHMSASTCSCHNNNSYYIFLYLYINVSTCVFCTYLFTKDKNTCWKKIFI